jgi:hypothetical protein
MTGNAAEVPGTKQEARTGSPILIIGTERSGSNLLRLVLDAHSQIAIPHPPHLMRYLGPLLPRYGDLADERNRRVLVRDATTLLNRHIHPWPHRIDAELVLAAAGPNLFSIVAAIYDQFRITEGKARWGCKSTFMVDHVAEVRAQYPDARFVWLVRDARDVACSSKRAVFNPCHPYLTALLWRRQQERALATRESFGHRAIHLLRYEDLVSRPELEVRRLCSFVGVPYEPAMLEHHRSTAAQETASLSESWRNAGRPIGVHSVGRYASGLTARERHQVEAVAGDLMRRLGYQVDPLMAAPRLPPLPLAHGVDLMLRLRVEFRSLRNDHNHWRRWLRDATVWWLWCRTGIRTVVRLPARAPRPATPRLPPKDRSHSS